MLDKFAVAKQREIERLKELDARNEMPLPRMKPCPSFYGALCDMGPGAVIAEYKRASPSKGDINLSLSPANVAHAYADAGAACMSVLTEEDYFKGDLAYLDACAPSGLPLLRKDFILHPLQVRATAATPASAVLLIARMVDADGLRALLDECDACGLDAVTEVFDEQDLDKARSAKARIIQVNNRDLDTLSVSLDVSRRMASLKHEGELWISASGVTRGTQVAELASLGFDAALVGTFLMEGGSPQQALATLIKESKV